MLLESAGWV